MNISVKGDYALHAVFDLAAQKPGEPVKIADIAKRQNIPQKFLELILAGLKQAGFVESRVDAQRRLYRIKPEPLMEIDAWLAPFRRFWSVHIDALERHLDQVDPVPHRKGKKR